MTLRNQILLELLERDSIAKAAIQECEDKIRGEAFAISTITGGPLSGTARRACQSRMDAAQRKKDALVQGNKWISEMVSKYNHGRTEQ